MTHRNQKTVQHIQKIKTILVIVFFCFYTSCISSNDFKNNFSNYQDKINYDGLIIKDSFEVATHINFKEKLGTIVRSYPKIDSKVLIEIFLINQHVDFSDSEDKNVTFGIYNNINHDIILVVYLNKDKIKEDFVLGIFYHELGHALWETLTEKQKLQWFLLFSYKLRHLNIIGFPLYPGMGNNWNKLENWEENLPSKYASKDVFEFFSEHFKHRNTDINHDKLYIEEHRMLLEHEK